MATRLKSITETSWLVIGDTDDTRIGLLTEIRDRYVLMVKGKKQQFLNRKEVNRFFNEDVFQNMLEPTDEICEKKTYFIKGFPVDFDSPNEVILKGNNLPLYSKKLTSDVYYVAGYFCLYFPRNIMPAYCPKFSTLQSYKYSGPFRTEFEMRAELTKLRKTKK